LDVVTRKLEGTIVRFDGTLFHVSQLAPQMNIEMARGIAAAMNELSNGKKYPVLMDSRTSRQNPTEEANQFFYSEEYKQSIEYMTVVLGGKWIVHGARIYSSFNNLPIEIKYFTSEWEAFDQIVKLNPECKESPLRPSPNTASSYLIEIDLYERVAEINMQGEGLNAVKAINALTQKLHDLGPTEKFRTSLIIHPFQPRLFSIVEATKLRKYSTEGVALVSTSWLWTTLCNILFRCSGHSSKLKCFNSAENAKPWLKALSSPVNTRNPERRADHLEAMDQMKIISGTLERFSQGDYSPIDTSRFQTNTQLHTYAGLINLMASKIRHQLADLETANRMLEERVLERTRELEEQKTRSIEQARLAAVGRFAASLAHEVNNPLAVIDGTSSLIQRRLERGELSNEELIRRLKTIDKMLDRTANIVKAVRNISRDKADGPVYSEELSDIVQETLVMVESMMRELEITLRVELKGPVHVDCRRTEIGQVLVNLINNARDAVEHEGKENRWIAIELFEAGSSAHVKISNGGPLIPKPIQDKMMEPFFTTKPVGKGTGLGLSLSQNIIKQHGGTLRLEPGTFTCFQIELPKSSGVGTSK
jgi:signal transduction histidine kinase